MFCKLEVAVSVILRVLHRFVSKKVWNILYKMSLRSCFAWQQPVELWVKPVQLRFQPVWLWHWLCLSLPFGTSGFTYQRLTRYPGILYRCRDWLTEIRMGAPIRGDIGLPRHVLKQVPSGAHHQGRSTTMFEYVTVSMTSLGYTWLWDFVDRPVIGRGCMSLTTIGS